MGADDLWKQAQANAVAARTSYLTCPRCHTTHIGGKKKFNREHGVSRCTLKARQDAAEAMDVDPGGLQLVADGAGHGHTGACRFRSVLVLLLCTVRLTHWFLHLHTCRCFNQ